MLRERLSALVAAAVLYALPAPLQSQIKASELGVMSQVVDGTTVSVTYSRPRSRGRSPIFGTTLAHWGETWTPGANWATLLDVSKDITLNGRTIPKGKYSVWMLLREKGEWTTILDPDFHRYHTEPPDSNAKQIRVPTQVDQAPYLDVLTWSVPELTVSGGTLAMQWGTTRASMKFGVSPSLVMTMPEADAQPYLGRWEWTGKTVMDNTVRTISFVILYENKTLKARWEPDDSYMHTFALIRVAPDTFTPGVYYKGEIYEVLRPDLMFTFKRVDGRPATLEFRDDTDTLLATAKHLP